jgi:hypothetical protein
VDSLALIEGEKKMENEEKPREPYTFPFTDEERADKHIEHKLLCSIVKNLPSDFEPWGERSDEERGGDCSCGCVFYKMLEEPLGGDWGVCANPQSPRCGLLTFEHQGCPQFTSDCVDENCEEEKTLAQHLRGEGRTCVFRCPRCGTERETLEGVMDERCHDHPRAKRHFVRMVKIQRPGAMNNGDTNDAPASGRTSP